MSNRVISFNSCCELIHFFDAETVQSGQKVSPRYLLPADRYAFSRIDRFGCNEDTENKKEMGEVSATRTYIVVTRLQVYGINELSMGIVS